MGILLVIALVYARTNKDVHPGLKMGVIAPLSGDYASVAENVIKGIRTAESVYETKTGDDVQIIVENDSGEAVKGLAAYKKLTEIDHINSLINVFPTTMDAIYEQTRQAGYPVMMEFFQVNNVADDHVFQMTPGNDGTWNKYAAYIKRQGYDDSNFIIVHSKDAGQQSFAKAFASFYPGKTISVEVSSDKNGLRTDAAKIASMKPTMILFIMPPENGAIITKEILPLIGTSTKLAYDVQLNTGISFYEEQLGDLAKIDGAIDINLEGEPNKEFLDAYHKLYQGEEPGFLADFGYDTFITYVQNHDKDNAVWISNLKKVDMKGASGQVRFDANGIRVPDLVVKKMTGGKLEVVERLPL